MPQAVHGASRPENSESPALPRLRIEPSYAVFLKLKQMPQAAGTVAITGLSIDRLECSDSPQGGRGGGHQTTVIYLHVMDAMARAAFARSTPADP